MRNLIPKPLEKTVQADCRAYLESLGCRVWRRNTGMFTGSHKGKSWAFKAGEVGAADLFFVDRGGRHYELEIKRPGERPTYAQTCYLRATNRFAPSFWVDSLEALQRLAPALLAGARVEYLDDEWTFTVEVKGKKQRITAPGADFDITY